MARYPSQKMIRFINSPKDDKGNYYSKYNNKDLINAQRNLSASAFKLYIYLGMFKEMQKSNTRFGLSKQEVVNSTGMSPRSYENAIRELKEKKYLVPDPTIEDKIYYVFIEKGGLDCL